jgi:hypothetical protein
LYAEFVFCRVHQACISFLASEEAPSFRGFSFFVGITCSSSRRKKPLIDTTSVLMERKHAPTTTTVQMQARLLGLFFKIGKFWVPQFVCKEKEFVGIVKSVL